METVKPKLEVLDALRGFCALMVVALHFCENYSNSLIPHGCLPVEYFFILTGFMMVYAYDGRWSQGLTFGSFFKRRVLRLQPLIVIGSLIGACCYFIAPQQYAPIVPRGETLGLGQLGLLFLWCSTLIPQPSLFGWKLMHTLQGPLWTMFYIYLANVLYAVLFRRLKTWILLILAILALGLTWHEGLLKGGFHAGPAWSCYWKTWSWDSFFRSSNFGALSRMFFPVLAGMVIARKGWRIRTGTWGLWLCVGVLLAIFFSPELRPNKLANGTLESLSVMIGMPLVLLLGIGGEIRNARLASVCRFLGKFSFPLYCTHYSMTVLQRVWRDAHPDAPWEYHLVSALVFALFAFFNAYCAMKMTDWFAARK